MQGYFAEGHLLDAQEEGSHRRFREALAGGVLDDEELLRNWRNEFFEKYGEEP